MEGDSTCTVTSTNISTNICTDTTTNITPSLLSISHIPLRIVRTNATTGSSCNVNNNKNENDSNHDKDNHDVPKVESQPKPQREPEHDGDPYCHEKDLSNSSSSVVTKQSVSEDDNNYKGSLYFGSGLIDSTEFAITGPDGEPSYNDRQDHYYFQSKDFDNNHRTYKSTEFHLQERNEQQEQAQEWTHEDHDRSNVMTSYHRSKQERRRQRQLAYERAERHRLNRLMMFGVAFLLLEVAAGSIAFMNYQELTECCGNTIFSGNSEQWNNVFYWMSISYLITIILIEIPSLVIAIEPLFLFNPMVGFLLAMHMIYVTDTKNAYIICGLETAAMVGQSIVLVKMQRSPELCIHSVLNYTLCGLVIFMLIRLTDEGGYCIVNDRIQSIFTISTCNIDCIDDASCFRCYDDTSSCFIQFSYSSES